MGVSSILKRYLPLSGSALALWAWHNRDEVVDWAAFGVRSAQSLVSGNTEDVKGEARLRMALERDRRTRHAPGLEVMVRDGALSPRCSAPRHAAKPGPSSRAATTRWMAN